MKNVFIGFPEFIRLGALALGLSMQMHVFAGTGANAPTTSLPSLPADLTELKFRDFFVMPIGPQGAEMSPKLLALDGQRVRILGYMAQQEEPRPGLFLLSPAPVNIAGTCGDEADDLPLAILFVHLPLAQANKVAPHQAGLLVLMGTLRIDNQEEGDGRMAIVRLQLDAPTDTQAQFSL